MYWYLSFFPHITHHCTLIVVPVLLSELFGWRPFLSALPGFRFPIFENLCGLHELGLKASASSFGGLIDPSIHVQGSCAGYLSKSFAETLPDTVNRHSWGRSITGLISKNVSGDFPRRMKLARSLSNGIGQAFLLPLCHVHNYLCNFMIQ